MRAGSCGASWSGEQLARGCCGARNGWEQGFLRPTTVRVTPKRRGEPKIEGIEAGRVVHFDGETRFDLLIGVPPHRAPAVVGQSPRGGEGGWVTVDPQTLATAYERVHA